MKTDFDVVIVGAGPAGSSAAILLARAGWSVALVEKESFPRRKVCGECVAASNFPLLEALGVGDEFAALAGPELRSTALFRGHSKLVTRLPAAEDTKYRWGRAIGREQLDSMLLEQARSMGAHVLQPWCVQSLQGRPGDWRCEVRAINSMHSITLHSRVAIDAHGSWQSLASTRRHQPQMRSGANLFAFKANFSGTGLAPGLLPVLSFNGGYGGMVLADSDLTTVACCIRRDVLVAARSASPSLPAGEIVESLLRREIFAVREVLHSSTRIGPWLAAGPINPGIRVSAEDQIFCIGNAAGEAHPIIGEGMSMALQSAWLLCAQLLRGESGAALRDELWQREASRRYAIAWRSHFTRRVRLAAALAKIAANPWLSMPGFAVTRCWPQTLAAAARWSGKTRCVVDKNWIGAWTARHEVDLTRDRFFYR